MHYDKIKNEYKAERERISALLGEGNISNQLEWLHDTMDDLHKLKHKKIDAWFNNDTAEEVKLMCQIEVVEKEIQEREMKLFYSIQNQESN